jgi:signal transduction histidine kinase
MSNHPAPLDRLTFFREQVGLGPRDLAIIEPHRAAFAARHDRFGQFFHAYFWGIPRTRLILEQERPPGNLGRVLGDWFRRLFSQELDDAFLQYLWDSGARHVEVNLDQRYVNLGYCVTRQFCQRLAEELVSLEERAAVQAAVDKLLDFCVLVATDSFITLTSRCDRQVIEGIAHQVRNPVTVIGGNIKRLQNQTPPDSSVHQAYERVLSENRRLEKMVHDITVYNQLFQSEPQPQASDLAQAAAAALNTLARKWRLAEFNIRQQWNEGHRRVLADRHDLETMFYYLLENSLEASEANGREIGLSSRAAGLEGFVELEIFNSGQPPAAGELGGLMAPFHSSKPLGTGFGLPVASLVARRNLGQLSLGPAPGGGVRCLVLLPQAQA